MAEPALRPMTVDEFLDWHPGDDRRYELVDGVPMLMAPPGDAHAVIAGNTIAAVGNGLRGTRCRVRVEGGTLVSRHGDRYYVPDFVVSCSAVHQERWTPEPRIVFEILSPSTENHDRKTKLPDYRAISSVEEIVLIDSQARYCEVHRRRGDDWPVAIYRGEDDVVELMDGQVELPLRDVYEGVELGGAEPDEPEGASGTD